MRVLAQCATSARQRGQAQPSPLHTCPCTLRHRLAATEMDTSMVEIQRCPYQTWHLDARLSRNLIETWLRSPPRRAPPPCDLTSSSSHLLSAAPCADRTIAELSVSSNRGIVA